MNYKFSSKELTVPENQFICLKADLLFIIKASLAYGSLAVAFSFIGLFLPEREYLDNPLTGGFDWQHISGHIVWGLMLGALSLSLRYFLLAGSFAIMIDWDHLIQFLEIEAIGRMGHSLPFGFLAVVVMILVFGKRDYLLGGISFAAVLAHISFDTLTGSGNLPLFAPFYDHLVRFPDSFWFIFQLLGAAVVIAGMILKRSQYVEVKKE